MELEKATKQCRKAREIERKTEEGKELQAGRSKTGLRVNNPYKI